MVSVMERDRYALRFLWFDDVFKETPRTAVFRLAHVVFGVSASPFLLNATLRHNVEAFDPDLVKESIYVDDIVFGSDSKDGAYNLFLQAKDLPRKGGFNL